MPRVHGRQLAVRFDRDRCCRLYDNPPALDVRNLPPYVKITLPPDGGFWLVNAETGVRYRRLTMDDLPNGVTWNTRGKASDYEDSE